MNNTDPDVLAALRAASAAGAIEREIREGKAPPTRGATVTLAIDERTQGAIAEMRDIVANMAALAERGEMQLDAAQAKLAECLAVSAKIDAFRAEQAATSVIRAVAPPEILKHFAYDHLPEGWMRDTSARFHDLAHECAANLPLAAETSTALRKLLEAKDAAVGAARVKIDRDRRIAALAQSSVRAVILDSEPEVEPAPYAGPLRFA